MENTEVKKIDTVSKELFKKATIILNDKIVNLEEKFANRKPETYNDKTKYRSDKLAEFAAALSKAQGEMEVAGKSSDGFKFKYADLTEVVRASRAALCDNGFSVLQQIITDRATGKDYIETVLLHESDQWMSSSLEVSPSELKGSSQMQSFGASITYLKRYCYASLVGVVSANEEDIDKKQ